MKQVAGLGDMKFDSEGLEWRQNYEMYSLRYQLQPRGLVGDHADAENMRKKVSEEQQKAEDIEEAFQTRDGNTRNIRRDGSRRTDSEAA